ncbi:hypothetical protein TIFTF001_036868 [Ficus carica]|uniref:Uncharacterized protein n=1 Tax=Ficus carica TaxID=3494 RepID=A0AA88E4I2_FICCA|nr:hypothetical protein TIFTF001_036868 [Ficus carica]
MAIIPEEVDLLTKLQLLFHKPKLSSKFNSRLRSPLHLASAEGHTEAVRVFLQENGDENICLAKDQDGNIPLHYAAMRGRIDVIKLLIGTRKESVLEVMPDGHSAALVYCEILAISIPGVKTGTDDIVYHRRLKAFELLEHIPGTDLRTTHSFLRVAQHHSSSDQWCPYEEQVLYVPFNSHNVRGGVGTGSYLLSRYDLVCIERSVDVVACFHHFVSCRTIFLLDCEEAMAQV